VFCHDAIVLETTIDSTGSWYRYTTANLGWLYLEHDKPTTLSVKVTLYQGCGKEQGGSPVSLHPADQMKPFQVLATGHFQDFQAVDLGTFDLAKGAHHLELRPTGKVKVAVMDVQKIVLSPAK
jgi:hypothetical protein